VPSSRRESPILQPKGGLSAVLSLGQVCFRILIGPDGSRFGRAVDEVHNAGGECLG
jgi:hypothetical protein